MRAHPRALPDGRVAGAPPDALQRRPASSGATRSTTGGAARGRGYRWWIERLRRTFELFDLARVDHFRGFVVRTGRCRQGAPNAARAAAGVAGPGAAVFRAVEAELGPLPLIAEDLGVITPAVARLRDELGLPGMLVLQFAFDPGRRKSPHRLENHTRGDVVVYTGTHDMDTAIGWWQSLSPRAQRAGPASTPSEPHWSMIRVTFCVAGVPGDRARPGRPRPRQPGAHEPPGHGARQLALATRPGSADGEPSRRGCATRRLRRVGFLSSSSRSAQRPRGRARRRARRSRPSRTARLRAPGRPSHRLRACRVAQQLVDALGDVRARSAPGRRGAREAVVARLERARAAR